MLFQWGLEEQKAFDAMKTLVASEPVIAQPLPKGTFHIKVDALGFVLGGVLSQHHPNGKWHPIAFISQVMSPAKLNYDIYNKELLMIMYALDEWQPYLLHATEPFEIWTDHKNLTYFWQPQKLNRWQAQWYSRLQEYDYTLKHILGATNSKADILLRLLWYKAKLLLPNNITMLPEWCIIKKASPTVTLFRDEQFSGGGAKMITIQSNIEEHIWQNRQKELRVSELEKQKLYLFLTEAGLLLFEGWVYIPPDPKIWQEILHDAHNTPIAGHPGIFKTNELIGQQYWWPTLLTDVKKYVKGCDTCQQNKASWLPKVNLLHPHSIPGGPWEDISVDLIGPLLESKGHNVILTIIDWFSKMIQLIPTTTEIMALRLAELYQDNIWKLHGLPQQIMSDRGSQFVAELMKSLCAMLGTKQNLSMAYHPQTDGHVEQSHQETEAFLWHYVDHLQDDWYEWLVIGEFQYNDKIHSSTNHTPFFLNYGHHPWKGEIQTSKGTNPSVEDFVHTLEIAQEEAMAAMTQAAEKAKQTTIYNNNRQDCIKWEISYG